MAQEQIRIRGEVSDGVASIKILIAHPMESGLRVDESSEQVVPAHFIEQIQCIHAGTRVLLANTSGMVARNPYLAFKFSGATAGDEMRIHWIDNLGNTDNAKITLDSVGD